MKGILAFYAYLILILSIICSLPSKMPLYIGKNIHTEASTKIYVYPDISFNETLISSTDFQCTGENGCLLQPTVQEGYFFGFKINYQYAYVQINVIKKPFTRPMRILYLENDVYNMGSIVGFYKSSIFFDYLFKSDKEAGYLIIFRLDWSNTLTFKQGVYQMDKLGLEYDLDAYIDFIDRPALKDGQKFRFCLTNRLDRSSGNTYFAVSHAYFEKWANLIAEGQENFENIGGSPLKYGIKFSLSAKDKSIGDMFITYNELYEDGILKIKTFDTSFDDGRNCDIYTGSLLLRKYNFKFYYIEHTDKFEVMFGYDNFNGWDKEGNDDYRSQRNISFLIKLIIFFIIMGVCAFCFIHYISRDQNYIPAPDSYSKSSQNIEDLTSPLSNKPG